MYTRVCPVRTWARKTASRRMEATRESAGHNYALSDAIEAAAVIIGCKPISNRPSDVVSTHTEIRALGL